MDSSLYKLFKKCNYQLSTDSRDIPQGGIFLALKGERFNGNQFAIQALKEGAAYSVIDEDLGEDNRLVRVESGLRALQDLAREHRRNSAAQIIGVAGSNGKTTTKELMAAVLAKRFITQATKGNLNNHIGVPLTLLSLRKDTQMMIVEMGANRAGEVEELCQIAEPDFGLITSIGKEHLEGFGSMEAIIETECALYQYVENRNGSNFVFADDPVLWERGKELKGRFTYGSGEENDLIGICREGESGVAISWETSYMSVDEAPVVQTALWGAHNFGNLLGAAAIGRYFGVSYDRINEALEDYRPSNNRSQVERRGDNKLIIDCYNANPGSMEPAIKQFAKEIGCEKRIAILGDMLELGKLSSYEHQNIIDLAEVLTIDVVWLVGEEFGKCSLPSERFLLFANTSEMKEKSPLSEIKNACILLKGSRGIKLESWLD